jgi:excisionase family DNA binding protein
MEFPKFPQEFSDQARTAVMVTFVNASQAIGSHQNVSEFIMSIFSVFAKEACILGRTKVWSIDRVDREARAFLSQTASYVAWRYGHLHGPAMFSNCEELLPEIQAMLENTQEWQQYQGELLKLAELQSIVKMGKGSRLVRLSTPSFLPIEMWQLVRGGDLNEKDSTPVAPQSPPIPGNKTRRFREPNLELLKNPDATLNRKNAAEALGVTERTLDRWITDKELIPVGPGSRKRFKTKDLLRLLNQNRRDKVDKTRQE